MNSINRAVDFFLKYKKEFSKQGIFKEASALSFITLTGMIPFTLFILFFIPEVAGFDSGMLENLLIKVMLPASAQKIIHILKSSVGNNSTYNIMTLSTVLITSIFLFLTVNRTFDKILYTFEHHRKEHLTVRIAKFFGMLILGFVFTAVIFSSGSITLISQFLDIPVLKVTLDLILPFLLLFIILLVGFSFIPGMQVKKSVVFISSSVTAFLWLAVKFIFNYYITYLTDFKILYGVWASIPAFMIWIYINWIIILSGVILIAVLEKRNEYSIPELHQSENKKTAVFTLQYQSDSDNIKLTSDDRTKISKIINLIAEELEDNE
ncbi:MAG: hypothetical protein CSB55_06030 [Candidatus Cloacimonadota bacterium]|nr:MAG: hypothetical protein CSB55_06030 [Candidatus Cloacimonadota bacterium]